MKRFSFSIHSIGSKKKKKYFFIRANKYFCQDCFTRFETKCLFGISKGFPRGVHVKSLGIVPEQIPDSLSSPRPREERRARESSKFTSGVPFRILANWSRLDTDSQAITIRQQLFVARWSCTLIGQQNSQERSRVVQKQKNKWVEFNKN